MKRIINLQILSLFLLFIVACTPTPLKPPQDENTQTDQEIITENLPEDLGMGEPSIVAHPQYDQNDLINCFNFQPGTIVTLEIDDPTTELDVDYSASRKVENFESGATYANFELGSDWDLRPSHIVTAFNEIESVQHTIRDIAISLSDFENDLITGTADPGTEVMVWIEAPYEYELIVTAYANGNWQADFTDITDIIPATIGAIAQNDVPKAGDSHTRVNFVFGDLHLETSLSDDVIGFNNFTPLHTLSFQIHDASDGSMIREGVLETNEVGYATFDNEDRAIDLVPGTVITAQDHATIREVSIEMGLLTIDTLDEDNGSISGQSKDGETVFINIYDRASEAEHTQQVEVGSDETWTIQFDMAFTQEMDIFARVHDNEGHETAYRWIWK